MAMPPAQDAMPPQQPDAGGAPPPDDAGGGDQQDPKQVLIEVNTGLAKILDVAMKAGAPDSVVKQFKMALDSFRGGVEELMSGKQGQPPGMQQHQVAPSEVGGNPNAVPMG